MTKATKSIAFAVALLGSAALAVAALLVMSDYSSAALPAQPSLKTHTLEVVGQAGGSFKAIAIQGEYAYIALGPRLAVLDVADAAQPTLKGQTGVLTIDIQALAVHGGYVYAAAGSDGLFIFSTSNPSQPVFVASLEVPGFASGVAFTGTHVFLSTNTDVRIVDVSQPTTPEAIGTYPAVVSDIAFNANVMYLARGDKISVLDISNPASPNLITDYNAPADEIEIGGNLAYIGKLGFFWGPEGPIPYGILRILDVSDPANITQVFFSGDEWPSRVPSQLRDMKLLDQRLYGYGAYCGGPSDPCSLEFGGVDVSNPISPTLAYISLYRAGRYDWYWGDFAVAGQHVYMATTDLLHIFDTSTDSEKGQYTSWSADKVTVANGVAYVAARSAGLLTLDVSTPERPTTMDAYTTTVEGGGIQPATISDMAVYGPYVYAQIFASGLGAPRVDVLDVSRSTDIQRAAIADWYLVPRRIHNGYGYYFDSNAGTILRNIDLSIPTQPTATTGIGTTAIPSGLALSGFYAYVIGGYQGLHIISVANPQTLVDVNRLSGPIPASLIDSTDKALYIFTDSALKIYDLSDPAYPLETSSTPLVGLDSHLNDMKVFNDYVYLAQTQAYTVSYGSTLRVFYAPDLTSPVNQVISYTRPGSSFSSIDVVGDLVYVASLKDGLLILRHTVSNPALTNNVYLPFIGKHAYSPPTNCTIAYQTFLQNHGWLNWVSDGSESGMAGQGLRVEALQVNLCHNLPESMGITYQAHVQEIGWMNWMYDGQIAGTMDQSKRLEAVRFKLLNAPDGYHIAYRVYIEGSGWTEPLSDGEIAGITGQSKRIEAIQIDLIQP